MEYTKGEWEVAQFRPLSSWVICLKGKDLLHRQKIAQCYENEADARLISAAPIGYELAEAVQIFSPFNRDDFLKVRAIAKKFMDKYNGN